MRSRVWAALMASLAFSLFNACKKSSSSSASAPETAAKPSRFPIQVGEKYGYIDTKGDVVIKPQFDRAERFSEGRAAVAIAEKYGYVDESGQMIVAPRFKYAGPFHAGRAPVSVPETGSGYVDPEGRLVIEAKYYGAYEFSEGLAAVTPNTDSVKELPLMYHWKPVQFINPAGDTVISKQLVVHDSPVFRDGLAAAGEKDGGTFGYIDKTGKFVIAPQFGSAYAFSEGFARICVEKWCNNDVGFVDKTGKVVITPDLDRAEDFSDGVALVTKNDEDYFIDKQGKKVLDVPAEHSASSFHESRAIISSPSDAAKQQCWYVDKSGKTISTKYFLCHDFDGGLALVTLDDEETTAYVDQNDKIVWRSKRI